MWINKNEQMPEEDERVVWGKWSKPYNITSWVTRNAANNKYCKKTIQSFTHWHRLPKPPLITDTASSCPHRHHTHDSGTIRCLDCGEVWSES